METLAFALSSGSFSPPSPLSLVLARMRAGGGTSVFDLDSTLLDNRPRQAAIAREFGAHIGEPAFTRVLPNHFESWDLGAAARSAGVPPEVVQARLSDLRSFWRERFFTSPYCRFDVVVPGAPDYVAEVASLGRVVYLTGRPPEMRAGTEESLKRLGFPPPGSGSTVLLLKPDAEMHDDLWKTKAVELADHLGPVVAAFDNEPTHINGYREAWPNALCIRVATDHSGRPVELAAGIAEIRSFVR
jgi:hypothetical protein